MRVYALGKNLNLFHWVLFINVNKKNIFWQKCVQGARKGKKYPFSHPVHIFVKIVYFFNSLWSKVLNEKIWDFSLKHAHVFFTLLILDSKVFKLERFSSVTWNVSVKHPILKVN